MNVRDAAVTTLLKIGQGGAFSTISVHQMLEKRAISKADVGLYTELVYGTLSRELTLDYILEPFLTKQKKLDPFIRPLLRMSVYQLFYLDRIPDHAVINEAVEIAKTRGKPHIAKVVNGVLRNVLRQGKPDFSAIPSVVDRISIETSHPAWLVERWIELFGEEETWQMCRLNNEPAPVTVRVNRTRTDRREAIELLEAQGVSAKPAHVAPDGLEIISGSVQQTDLLERGYLSLQDESSMLVAAALGAQPTDRVLDSCAAPGGKAMHIAEGLANGSLLALDLHPHKVKLLEKQAVRLRLENVQAEALDARQAGTRFEAASFDRVLVDAPCSGLGVIRRKPDIKWTKRPEDLTQLPVIQRQILEAVLPLVKPDGTFVYSTCTMDPLENEQQTDYILSQGFVFDETFKTRMPEAVQSLIGERAELKLLPTSLGTDGFYIAAFKKVNEPTG
ncbi:16S rRNA (cytosine(967)-C(5))-methyltransferase RsmB [Exiguobacterium sp. RIT594]|uniref:16S rRNA (cytosine(967)-C(5))-methyltransferase RsmB n=1 Tax=Exiguobacterium sp. RIT594 TaxID=2282449 RepID=UPI000DF742E9|nr:16S rRNA (cytosine(967)-C(5))-methyltransferase RsmB [Exiguobacterium sp. RIT594]RDB33734.1 16S rRNA (cytosine(967)-C(5))-methyltransferase RsmB [Exiguobacterium sp. RIT594]